MSTYIGRCPDCGAINAAVVNDKDAATDIKDMLARGLRVELVESNDPVTLWDCEHCKARRHARRVCK